jgi:twitching motility protein PilT
MAITKDDFLKLIKSAVSNEVSDVHIREGERPCFRIKGDLTPIKVDPYSYDDVKLISSVLIKDKSKLQKYDELKEYDGSFEVKGLCRVRVNLLRFQGKVAIILRIINAKVPTVEDLGLPNVVSRISMARNGLVLVTGATGSGKSSTLAAMINYINKNRQSHILTLEDPIEFVHESIKSKVTQREIGEDTDDFTVALRSALRQDPDIILIGEMRDAETVSIAIKAAETGHLVFGTVHTTNALTTIGRLISMFPPGEQKQVRERIADNLYATISQRLAKTKDGKGRVAVQEIMVTSPGIKEAIANSEKTSEIYTYIEKNKKGQGTMSFDQCLTDLYREGKITLEEAKLHATSPEDFERNLMFGSEN